MISNARFKRPVISFGLSLTMLSCEPGDEVNVYVNDLYNENEYSIVQDVVQEVLILRYIETSGPDILTAEFVKIEEQVNERNVYFNGSDFINAFFIIWDGEAWRLIAGTPGTEFITTLGILNVQTLIPEGDWQSTGANIIPISTSSNINSQAFKFTAPENDMDIQIKIRSKSGLELPSNTIKLIVNQSS
jgi:hypothetical protein